MARFAIIAEGPTDQRVIENIICGIMPADDGGPVVVDVQPPPNAPGGWTLVLDALRKGEVGRALTFNDYVVIHIDSDVCEEPGFDVPRRMGDRELNPSELVDAVSQRLQREIGDFYPEHRQQIVFAISVDSIECWLLPLLFESQNAKGADPSARRGCRVKPVG